jgi:hypothetical protein
MANYFANLPAYRDPGGLEFAPLNQAVQNFGETSRQNVMAEYAAQRNKVADARSARAEGRAQQTFDEAKGKEALNQLAGMYQAIEAAPEAERPSMIQRALPAYGRLRQVIPGFNEDFAELGADPNDFMTVGKLIAGRVRGPVDPLEAQYKQAQISETQAKAKYYNERPAGGAAGAGGATGALADRLMAENPGMTLEQAITIAKRGDISGAARDRELGEAEGKAGADIPRITANAERALQTVQQIKAHPGKQYGLGWTAASSAIPGTDARGFANLVDQAKGQTFLEAFNSLRGGGQITEAEGQKATQALARLDRYQSEADFNQALKDLEDVITKGLEVARQKASGARMQPAAGGDGWTDVGGVKIRVKQ